MARRPVVFVTRRLPEAVEAALAERFEVHGNPTDRAFTTEELVAGALAADGVLTTATERWTAAMLARIAGRVGIIATFSVGTDHIDLEAARRLGIRVTNTPDVLTEATADVAMLCLLGAARRAFEAQRDLRAGVWSRWSPTGYLGLELHGRTLGIVGMGRIGRAVARRARGFGMTIRYHNRRRLPPELEEGAIWHPTLEDLLPHCHVLSLHCPGTPENHHLLSRERVYRLPRGAVVVNTARGTVVNEEALLEALDEGHLFAVGLDVFANEPQVDHRWFTRPRAFLLPHIGSATHETRIAMGMRCVENLEAFFAGREPPHRVA